MAAHKRSIYVPETPRHIRLKRSRIENGKDVRRVSSQVSLMCISNGFNQSPRSVLLRLENQSFLIGCGESTQRILAELPYKYFKISQILISRMHWSQIGGILGMSITFNNAGVEELSLNAPGDITPLLQMLRSLENYKSLKIVEQSNPYADDSFKINKFVYPTNNSFCFFVLQSQPLPGKLSTNKCNLLGVPANHCRARLKNGDSITLESGQVIKPSDVLHQPLPILRITVIDIPDTSQQNQNFLLQTIDALDHHQSTQQNYFLHLTQSNIRRSTIYTDLMQSREYFKTGLHLLLDEQEMNIESISIQSIQRELNAVDPEFFPEFPLKLSDQQKRSKSATISSS